MIRIFRRQTFSQFGHIDEIVRERSGDCVRGRGVHVNARDKFDFRQGFLILHSGIEFDWFIHDLYFKKSRNHHKNHERGGLFDQIV